MKLEGDLYLIFIPILMRAEVWVVKLTFMLLIKRKQVFVFDWRHAIFSINSIYLQFALFFILFVKWKIISETAAEILVIYMCLCL